MHSIAAAGQTSVSLYFLGVTTSTGAARTDIVYNTAGLALSYTRERAAEVVALVGSGTPPVSLAAVTTAWTQWGFIHVGGGLYRVDFPNLAFATPGARFVITRVYGPADTTFVPVTMGDMNAVKVQDIVQTGGDVFAKLTTIEGYVDTETSAAAIRAALGMAAANLDTQLSTIAGYVDTETTAAAIRAAIGLGAANLDAQLSTITSSVSAAAIRAAIGLGSANLDATLSTIAGYVDTETSATAIRAAIGLAAANLDAQLASIGSGGGGGGMTAADIRAAIGLAAPNLDTQLNTIAGYVDTETSAVAIRAAIGLASANIDAQFAALGSGSMTAAGIRSAIGMAAANMDTQLAAMPVNVRTAIGMAAANLDNQLSLIPTSVRDVSLAGSSAGSMGERIVQTASFVDTEITAIQNAIAALNNLSAAGVRAAIGLSSANLDVQLAAMPIGVRDVSLAGVTAGSMGERIVQTASYVDTEIAAIQTAIAALNNLSPAGVRAAIGLSSANLDAQLSGMPVAVRDVPVAGTAAGSLGEKVVQTAGFVDTEITALQNSVNAIPAAVRDVTLVGAAAGSLGERVVQTSSYVDTEIAAIQAAIAALNNLSAAGVRAAVGMAAANLDAQLAALPAGVRDVPINASAVGSVGERIVQTAGYVDTEVAALQTAVAAVQSAIAALNNLSAAGVRAAVGMASANLDTQLAGMPAGVRDVSIASAAVGSLGEKIIQTAGYVDTEMGALTSAVSGIPLAVRDVAIAGAAPGSLGEKILQTAGFVDTEITAIQNAIAALNNLDAAGVRAAIGLAAANLDAQLNALPTGPENADALLARHYMGGSDGTSGAKDRVSDTLVSGLMRYTLNPSTKELVIYHADGSIYRQETIVDNINLGTVVQVGH